MTLCEISLKMIQWYKYRVDVSLYLVIFFWIIHHTKKMYWSLADEKLESPEYKGEMQGVWQESLISLEDITYIRFHFLKSTKFLVRFSIVKKKDYSNSTNGTPWTVPICSGEVNMKNLITSVKVRTR